MAENENNDKGFEQEADEKKETEEPIDYKQKTDELDSLLEKERQKSLRLLADYQNLEKQIIDRVNSRGDKIILDFLTVYEDFIRTKDAYEKEGGNVDNLDSYFKLLNVYSFFWTNLFWNRFLTFLTFSKNPGIFDLIEKINFFE